MIAIALLRHYHLEFSQSGLLFSGSQSMDRQLTGIIAIGASLLISIPLLVGYVFFDTASSLLVSQSTVPRGKRQEETGSQILLFDKLPHD